MIVRADEINAAFNTGLHLSAIAKDNSGRDGERVQIMEEIDADVMC